jgi:hypothetical protein
MLIQAVYLGALFMTNCWRLTCPGLRPRSRVYARQNEAEPAKPQASAIWVNGRSVAVSS